MEHFLAFVAFSDSFFRSSSRECYLRLRFLVHSPIKRFKLLGILKVQKKVIYGGDGIIERGIMHKMKHFAMRKTELRIVSACTCHKATSRIITKCLHIILSA